MITSQFYVIGQANASDDCYIDTITNIFNTKEEALKKLDDIINEKKYTEGYYVKEDYDIGTFTTTLTRERRFY